MRCSMKNMMIVLGLFLTFQMVHGSEKTLGNKEEDKLRAKIVTTSTPPIAIPPCVIIIRDGDKSGNLDFSFALRHVQQNQGKIHREILEERRKENKEDSPEVNFLSDEEDDDMIVGRMSVMSGRRSEVPAPSPCERSR